MRIPWLQEGKDPDYEKYRRYGMDTVSRSIRDPKTTPAALLEDKAQGFKTGVYFAWNWYPNLSGKMLAVVVSRELEALAPGTQPDDPRVCANIESHNVNYVLAFFTEWRQRRQKRLTDFALENHQAGLFNAAAVGTLIACNVLIVPEQYEGNMEPVAGMESMRDWLDVGMPAPRIYGFYDGAHLPNWWQGYCFDEGRLP